MRSRSSEDRDGDGPCPTCGGDRWIEVDAFDPTFGHRSVAEPCPDCDEDDDEFVDEEDDVLSPLERGAPYV